MALQLNRVMLAGNLTRDPQVRFFANEKAVTEFSLAINRRYKTADGQLKEEVTFVDIEAFGRTAELVGQYLTKGRACFVEGRLRLDSWEDKKDGQKRSKLRVVADNVHFLDSNKDRQGAASAGGERDAAAAPSDRDADAPGEPAAGPGRRAASSAALSDDEPPF